MASKANLNPGENRLRLRSCSICIRQQDGRSEILMVRLKDPTSGRMLRTPPGGAIEPDETPLQTALRETFEETGYHVKPVRESGRHADKVLQYDFPWDGKIVSCETHFFVCELANPHARPADVRDADYNLGAEWMDLAQLESALLKELQVPELIATILRLARRD